MLLHLRPHPPQRRPSRRVTRSPSRVCRARTCSPPTGLKLHRSRRQRSKKRSRSSRCRWSPRSRANPTARRGAASCHKHVTHLVPCADTRRAKTRRCLSFRSGWSGVRNRWCVTRGAASHVGCPTRRPPYRRALHAGRPEVRVALRDEFAHVPVFELQVMPPLPYLLECAPDALDYATAAVFVCSKSCGGAGNFVEFVAAQAF